jgi:hypothetical protein
VQLAAPGDTEPVPTSIPAALERAVRLRGHAPAVTVIGATRAEQGTASLAQWAAKGAHLLVDELGLAPGEVLGIDLDPSWTTAAVCLAAWWAGLVVDPDDDAGVVVAHERRGRRGAVETLWVGDGMDGSPLEEVPGEPWPIAVQSFPDTPPPPRAVGGPALRMAGQLDTQAALLSEVADMPPGTVGVEVGRTSARVALLAVSLRPLVALHPTVVLDHVGRDAAAGDRVRAWL